MLNQFSQISIAGNHISQIIIFFSFVLSAFVVGKLGSLVSLQCAKRFETKNQLLLQTFFVALSKSITFFVLVVGFDVALLSLSISNFANIFLEPAISTLYVIALAYVLYNGVDVIDQWLTSCANKSDTRLDDMLIPLVRKSLRVTIVVLALLQVATVLSDKPLTSVLAGLGVGGLAVALAAQDTIKNFFGSILIFSDKPFELGDRVKVDKYDGTVEEVGFRSTRIRLLDDSLVTVPNGELANKSIQNMSRRTSIKQSLVLGLVYNTNLDKLTRAVKILEDLLHEHEGMHVDQPARVYLNELAESAINISVTYWYHPADYWLFCEFHQGLCIEILKAFKQEGIELAFPSQTLYVRSEAV